MSTLSVNKITDLTDFTFPPTTTINIVGVTGSGTSTFGRVNTANLVITGTSGRITGDFGNATNANRVIFQNSTVNGGSRVSVMPNGTASSSGFEAYSGPSTDPNNASIAVMAAQGTTDARFSSTISGTGTYLPMTFYTGGSERMRIDTSGNVAIGSTATGQGTFSVYGPNAGAPATSGSADSNITKRTRTQNVALDIGTYAAGQTWIQNRLYNNYATNYDIVLQPNGGNVGFGGLGYCKTDVTGVIRTTSIGAPASGAGLELSYGGTANTADILSYDRTGGAFKNIEMRANNIIFNVGGAGEKARVTSGGGFSVGTTADPGAGAIYATGNITAYYSDERLKENITPISNALAKVNSISGVTYNGNDLAAEYGYDDRSQQVGVLAQEIQQILPEAVKHAPFDIAVDADGVEYSKSGETYLTVQYEKLVPLLVEAIKELTKRVEELESK